jgi:transposase
MGRQQDCSNCKRLRNQVGDLQEQLRGLKAQNRSLRQRIERLEETLRESKRQATPFGRSSKNKPRKENGSPGRKKGKGPFKRRQPPPESKLQTVVVPLARCPDCGGEIENRKQHEQLQSDIPPVKPVHIRFVTESGYCPRCGRRFRSRHPDQCSDGTGAAGVVIGPNAKSIGALLKHRHGVSYEKVAEMFDDIFDLRVARSTLCRAGRRLALKGRAVYERLREELRVSPAAFSDETGWRIGTRPAWLWAVTSCDTTVYDIRKSRGHEVLTGILGSDYEGVLHADCFLAYDSKDLQGWKHQKCFAHLIHQLSELAESKSRGAVRFPRNVLALLREAMALGRGKQELSQAEFEEELGRIEDRLEALISEDRCFSDPDNRRFAKRLRRHRGHMFTFLTREGSEPTNNRAERAIRPAVVARKMGGCNENTYGAETHAILASILATAKQRGVQGLSYLRSIVASRERPPPLPAAA